MAKHYISINEKKEVVRTYTDDFEAQKTGDICVNQNGPRHFVLDLRDMLGNCLYEYVSKKVRLKT